MAYHAPPKNCNHCARLVALRTQYQQSQPDWYNGAVPCFGNSKARLLVVGLAPGAKGANRTGRPFTGDGAGRWLYAALGRAGLAQGTYGAHARDGLMLRETMITNAVRCVPPDNTPTTAELTQCRVFLKARLGSLKQLRVIVTLGGLAHASTVRALGYRPSAYPFTHGGRWLINGLWLHASYHCSQRNISTKRLTPTMLDTVLRRAKADIACQGLQKRHGSVECPTT